ncbi:hypothetical protein [Bacillus cereus]|uniref:hypothetical protein n=1 Tax=Bacillus cereus TaxID=1396 RepID=UPI00065BBCC6|nr:hypothetical protein [Bacillus cereus]KMQ09306.1 hypothetical protein TU67_04870 [Bacillus cereus]
MNNLTKILIGALSVSIVYSGVLTYNTKKEFDNKDRENKITFDKKDKTISELKSKLDQASTKSNNEDTNVQDKSGVNPVIDLQNQYKDISNQFVHAYLNYSVKNKGERRNNLLKITDKKVVDMVAPDTEDIGDPNFKSTVNNAEFFIGSSEDISKKCSVLIDVEYTIEGLENKQTTIKNLIKITLEKQGNEIKVVDYITYPTKR